VASQRWHVVLNDVTYDIEAKRSWTGNIRVLVNGADVGHPVSGQRIVFPLGGGAATLAWIAYGKGGIYYDVIVGGRSLATGGQARPAANPYESLGASWLLFIAVAAIFGCVLFFGALPEIRLALEGREASAYVTGGRIATGRSTSYYLRYEFVVTGDTVRAAEGRVSYDTYRSAHVGDEIAIVYVPSARDIQRPASFDERIWLLALLAMFGAGLPFTVAMVWRAYRLRSITTAMADSGIRTTATVNKISKDLGAQGTRRISYSYEDPEGRVRKGRSPRLYVEEAAAYAPGSMATIVYDANHPANSMWIGAVDPNATAWVMGAK
jgi:hypothetical protein